MSYGAFATKPAFNAGRIAIPPPTRAGLGQYLETAQGADLFYYGGAHSPLDVGFPLPTDQPVPPAVQDVSGPAGQGDVADVVNSGIDSGTAHLLVAEGATSAQMQNLATGATTLPELMAQLTGASPAPGQPLATAPDFAAFANAALQPVQLTGNAPTGTATGSVLATEMPTPTPDWSTWIKSNAWWIAGGVLAVVLIPPLLRKL